MALLMKANSGGGRKSCIANPGQRCKQYTPLKGVGSLLVGSFSLKTGKCSPADDFPLSGSAEFPGVDFMPEMSYVVSIWKNLWVTTKVNISLIFSERYK